MTTTTVTMTAETAKTALENMKKVSYIGGNNELKITRNELQTLIESGLIPKKSGTLLFVLMHCGMEFLSNGMDVFKEEGSFAKFARAYDLDPQEAYKHLVSFKNCYVPLEESAVQLCLLLGEND